MRTLRFIVLLIGIITLGFFYIHNQIKVFRVKDIKIVSNKILNEIKITQISDFHSNKRIDLEKLKNEIKGFDPNFIVLTGDIIDRNDDNLEAAIQLIETISNLNKDIYYIKGNHENDNRLYNNFKIEMVKRGIIVLEDDTSTLEIHGNMINIIGLRDTSDEELNYGISEYEKTIENLNLDYYNLLLIHAPNNVEELIHGSEDLILSGHTHGGQIRLPMIGPIVAPGQGLFPTLDKGIYEIGDAILYIDSGLGNSLAPIRILNPVQFTNITIEGELNEIH